METNALQEGRDSPLVPKLLAMHRTLTTKAPHPFYRFTGVLMRSSHARLQRETSSLSSRYDNDIRREKRKKEEKRVSLHQKDRMQVQHQNIIYMYNLLYIYLKNNF